MRRSGTGGRGTRAAPRPAGFLPRIGLALALGAASASCGDAPFWPGPEAAERAFAALYREARGRVLAGDFARPDGFAYAVDIGELLKLAARRSDREMADALRAFARSRLLVDSPDDPFTRGFVAWRRSPDPAPEGDDRPDASGTTEALRVSQGLRETAAAFDAAEDREDALLILEGYARHAADAEGLLLVRNYFDLGSRAFATNSFLVDYGPDYLARVGRAERREDFAALARRSYEVVRAAESPAGLLYDVFQPEMATLFDDRRTLLYSPNDIVQTSNAASVALQAVEGAPEVADRVLAFCRERMPGLKLAYYGRTGEPARQKRPGIEIWGTLTELAARRGDRASIRAFAPFLVTNASADRVPEDAFLYVAAHLLLGLDALGDFYGSAPRAAAE